MNNKFTGEQIGVYAKEFRTGDAIWSDGEWHKVKYDNMNRATPNIDTNEFILNWLVESNESDEFDEFETERIGGLNGFRGYKPYRVTTLKDYKLQGGEKIVRLDDTSARVSFGKSYTVSNFRDEDEYYWVICDNGERFYIDEIEEIEFLNYWGIIPRYEQVKEKRGEEVSDEIKVVEKSGYTGKFKIGDRVKVVAVTKFEKKHNWIEVGEAGIVIDLDEDAVAGYQYQVNFREGDVDWFNEATLELVQEGESIRPASSHYHQDNNGNDVWQFADDNLSAERVKGFHQVNALKYITRYEEKHDTTEKRIEDLEKAKISIDKLIELER